MAARPFFASSNFAVVGASKDPSKFGNIVLKWYKSRQLPVTPINPKEATIEDLPVLSSIADLPSPETTSISVVSPPAVTLSVLKEAVKLGIPAIWLQPGAEVGAVRKYVKDEGIEDRVTLGGPCVLVLGQDMLDRARKDGLTKL